MYFGSHNRHPSDDTLHRNELVDKVRLKSARSHVVGAEVAFKTHIILFSLGWELFVRCIGKRLLLVVALLLIVLQVLH